MTWLAVKTFLGSPLGRQILAGLTIALVLTMLLLGLRGHWIGQGVAKEQRAEAARLKAAQSKVAKREDKAAKITADVGADLQKNRVQIAYRTRVLIKEVPAYVSPAADAECVVPAGFVRLHDAAALGSPTGVPGPARGPVDAPSGVPLSAVAATVVGNYGVAYDWRAEALSWRAWYTRQSAEWAKP